MIHEHAVAMVQCKVLKQLELLEARKFDDPDIVDDLEFLNEKLQESVQDLRWGRKQERSEQLYLIDQFSGIINILMVHYHHFFLLFTNCSVSYHNCN